MKRTDKSATADQPTPAERLALRVAALNRLDSAMADALSTPATSGSVRGVA